MGKSLKGKELGRGLYQRSDGLYVASIYLKGSPKPIYIYDSNLAKLKKKRDHEKARYIIGLSVDSKKYTVAEWFEEWMRLYNVGRLKNTTVNGYVDGFERVTDIIGSVRLNSLTPTHIYNMIEFLQKDGYAETSVIHSLAIVNLLLNSAVENRMIPMNPCKGLTIKKPEEAVIDPIYEDEGKILTKEEIETFLSAAKKTRYYEVFYIILNTGMRIGELAALMWEDIDFHAHRIRIYKTLNKTTIFYDDSKRRIENPYNIKQITTPKKKASYRWIPMSKSVENAFLSWKAKQDADKVKYGTKWGKDNALLEQYPNLVFTTQPGNLFLPQYGSRECSRILKIIDKKEIKRAELENREPHLYSVYPHKFRHTFVTRMNQSNMSPFTVRKIAGHSNINMTNYYTHLETEYISEEFNKFIARYEAETCAPVLDDTAKE